MSLQVWLPLNGNLENQGLSDLTYSGNPVYKSSGKLGNKCLDLNTRITFNCPSLNYIKTYSVTFWAKVNSDATQSTNWVDVIGFTDRKSDGSATGQLRWETCYDSSYVTRGISSHDNATNATSNGLGVIVGKGKDVWHHISITVDVENNKINEYCNGLLVHTTTTNGGSLTGTFWIGETNKINGEIQDVRIYDHALSVKEIKELSKGLVLHYKLSGVGGENLLNNNKFINGTSNWYGVNNSKISTTTIDDIIVATGTKGTSNNIIGQTCSNYNYVGGSTINITVSAKVYVTETGTFGVGHWISTTQASGWKVMSGSRVWNTPQTLSIGWNYISTTLKNATNQYNGSIVTAFSFSGATFYITNVKFEIGIKSTPWIPNPSNTEYTFLEYNDTTEYDHSGFGNNGVKTNITTDVDTPRYSTSYLLNGSSYIKTTNNAWMSQYAQEMTVNI